MVQTGPKICRQQPKFPKRFDLDDFNPLEISAAAYMIVRSVSGLHICLRCRLGLARLPALSRTQSAFQSTTARPWDGRDDGRRDEEPSEDTLPARYPGVYRPLTSAARAGGVSEGKLSEFPLGRLYGFRGRRLREQKEDLSVDNMGKPSQVIVLRDHGVNFAAAPEIPSVEAEPLEPVDIMARLDSERGLAGHQEVMDNIEGLKPKEPQLENWAAFDALMSELSKGFTVLQLARYIDARGVASEQGKEHSTTRKADKDASIAASSWMPGLSESIDHFNTGLSRGYYKPETLTKKERLALLLLRGCWSVTVPEVEEGQGETEVAIPQSELDWLLSKFLQLRVL